MRQSLKPCPVEFLGALRQKAGYHHGNLKETLLDAAETLLAQGDPVSLSELARMAGVSPAAIYRHYADLPMLISAVAKRGFEAFRQQLLEASAASGHGMNGLRAMGCAYLAFARQRPGAYTAMFSSPISCSKGEVAAAGSDAFHAFADTLAMALTEQGIPTGAAFSLATKIWALSHGIATLTGAGRLSPAIGTTPESMLLDGVAAMIAAARG